MEYLKLRAHHGMCLAFFSGKGYSSDFTAHMAAVKERLEAEPSQIIEITDGFDEICSACPNAGKDRPGMCASQENVSRYDAMTLRLAGFSLDEKSKIRLSWADFSGRVGERILETGRREEICGDCQWSGICRHPQESGLTIRRSTPEDLPVIMEIYAYARGFMAEHGNPNQWGPTRWPPEALIRRDIAEGNSYVCVSGSRIVGTFYYICGKDIEPTYRRIEDGAWLDDTPYGVVHRLASDGSVKGTGARCISWAYEQCGHLRIDTHGDNTVMQGLLAKLGFASCGTIYVEEDDFPRLAYEKSENHRSL